MKNARKYDRADINTKVKYAIINEGDAKNISAGGICVVTIEALEKDKDMTIIFSLPGNTEEKLKVFGKVKWSRVIKPNICESGIEFWDVDETVRKQIEEYIKKYLSKNK